MNYVGTNGHDDVFGTAGDDTIRGLGGADILRGAGGDDKVYGGGGADFLSGDTSDGTLGDDLLSGGGGDDTITTRNGADTLSGGAGDDLIYFMHAAATDELMKVSGGAGEDRIQISSSLAHDRLRVNGGDGVDVIDVTGFTRPVVHGGGGDDTIIYRSAFGRVAGGDGDDGIRVQSFGHVDVAGDAGDDSIGLTVFETSSYLLSLGEGRDSFGLSLQSTFEPDAAPIIVSDFQTGPGGDRFDGPFGDPGASVDVRLVQRGSDAVYQFDVVGGGGATHDWVSWIIFSDTDAASFTADNFVV